MTATEANRRFSELLREASKGEWVTIISHDRPIARIGPASTGASDKELAKQRLLKRVRQKEPTGEPRTWTRDELYD
jgi:prevent-host-death family protein